jgi:hypothetical protein
MTRRVIAGAALGGRCGLLSERSDAPGPEVGAPAQQPCGPAETGTTLLDGRPIHYGKTC